MRRRRTGGSLTTDDAARFAAGLARARATLARSPAGLLTDLDGTLAPIVAVPSQARPTAGAVEALQALAGRLAVVGVVTGREALEARRILGGSPALLVIGNHGLEWLEPGAVGPTDEPAFDHARRAVAAALARVPRKDGISVEHKGLSATVHYRQALVPGAAREAVLHALVPERAEGLEIREGRMSVEVRPAGLGDKGAAVRRVVQRFGLRGLVVAGDDVTDLDMFAAARELGRSPRLRVAILAVAGGGEVPAEVSAAADVTLPDPAAFAALLAQLAAGLMV
ncbi:MAG: trehalose-phosphatase [Chloroflexota bacterium]|nr:trehalose-phosphatase [Chloroflexota bacterium]